MKLSSTVYKSLNRLRSIPKPLTELSYSGNIIFNETQDRKDLGWVPDTIFTSLGQAVTGFLGQYEQDSTIIATNSAGDRFIVGVPSVHAEVYSLSSNNAWVRTGQQILNEAEGDNVGFSVCINSEGDRIAVGSPGNDNSGTPNLNFGHTRIFQLSSDMWVQMGTDINGLSGGRPTSIVNFLTGADNSGSSIDMNTVGDRIIIGEPGAPDVGINGGRVRVFQWTGGTNITGTWVQLGSTIPSVNGANAGTGGSVSMNASGNIIAVGAPNAQVIVGGTRNSSGSVNIYQLSGNDWVQLGQNINAKSTNGLFGKSVALNATGNRIIVGSPLYRKFGSINENTVGLAAVYELNSNNTWEQVGDDIVRTIGPVLTGFQLGRFVTINDTGDIVYIGSDMSEYLFGYKLDSNRKWVQTIGDRVQRYNRVSSNSLGNIVAVGKTGRGLSENGDIARVLKYDEANKLDRPFIAFDDDIITVNRPTWRSTKNLSITGGWYNTATKQYITNINQTSVSTATAPDLFTDIFNYRGIKWVETATNKYTNVSTTISQQSAIYFKNGGFTPILKEIPSILARNGADIIRSSEYYNSMFRGFVPRNSVLSAMKIDDLYLNFTPEMRTLSSSTPVWTVSGVNTFEMFQADAITLSDFPQNTTVSYQISANNNYKDTVTRTARTSNAITVDPWLFTLGNNMLSSLSARLTNVTPSSATKDLFIIRNPATNTFIRNPNVWCAYLVDQLTGLVTYKNRNSIYSYGGTLITPRHVLWTGHAIPRPDTLFFVTTNSVTITANQIGLAESKLFIDNGGDPEMMSLLSAIPPSLYTPINPRDMAITVLDRDVSLSGINPLPLASITYEEYDILRKTNMPFLRSTQAPGRLVNPDTAAPNTNLPSAGHLQIALMSSGAVSDVALRSDVYNSKDPFRHFDTFALGLKVWDGDSGNIVMMCHNDKLYVYDILSGATVSALSGAVNFLTRKADQAAGINTGLRPTYYTIEQIMNR